MDAVFPDQEIEDYKNLNNVEVPYHITALCGLFFHQIPV